MTKKILFVDDDSTILRSYQRYVGLKFNLDTALGGELGLKMLGEKGPYAVVVSDMRMPGMDGTQFLSQVRERTPDSVRMLLTGQADMNDAIAVVNEGQIFRFLTKPCPPEVFSQALNDGIELYRLVTAEKELLEKTLKGSIKLLVDIISIVSPDTFSRSVRVRTLATQIASRLNFKDSWKVDVAALLSQIGCVTIPQEIVSKKSKGESLSRDEHTIFSKHLKAGKDLVSNIPRLEEISEAIAYQEKKFDGSGFPKDLIKGTEIPFIARILKVALDFDDLVATGKSGKQVVAIMEQQAVWYDPDVFAALKAEVLQADKGFVVREIRAKDVRTGMVLADDLFTKTHLLLVSKRHEISDTLRICILNFAENNNIAEPINILEYVNKQE